jgi:hypothetical protein
MGIVSDVLKSRGSRNFLGRIFLIVLLLFSIPALAQEKPMGPPPSLVVAAAVRAGLAADGVPRHGLL